MRVVLQPEIPVKDHRDPERRRAKLMASQKKRAKLYQSQSWAAPSTRAPAGHHLISAQQLRDRGAEREKGLSKSWSSPGKRAGPKLGLKVDIPLNGCSGELGNFWGTSPHSPQKLEQMRINEQKQNALLGQAYAPVSPVSIIYAKKAARKLRKTANERAKESSQEKARRKKEEKRREREFMESMLEEMSSNTD